MTKLKVLHAGISFFPQNGGSTQRLFQLWQGCKDIHLDLATFVYEPLNKNNVFQNIITYNNNLIGNFWLAIRLFNLKHDVIILHNPRVALSILLVSKVMFWWKPKLIYEVHNLKSGLRHSFVFKIISSHVNSLVVMSRLSSKSIIDAGVPEEKLTIIRNGIKMVDEKNISHSLTSKPVFGYIGSFSLWQGMENVISLALLNPKVEFIVAGSGPEYWTKRIRLIDNITHMGWLEDINEFYRSVDVCLILRQSTPGTETIVPLKVVESIAYKKVILMTDVGGLKEPIDGTNYPVIIARADDIDSINKKLNEVLETYNTLSNRAVLFPVNEITDQYDWIKSQMQYIKLIRKVWQELI